MHVHNFSSSFAYPYLIDTVVYQNSRTISSPPLKSLEGTDIHCCTAVLSKSDGNLNTTITKLAETRT